ncbi:hypothetical protein [Streptomyces sp. NPDC045714]|uniref:hypothetical protein n=1 Tax=Streptomyces sp. NPDC045714 TaxID=3154913 RepID=UPI0033DA05B0
MEEGFKNWCGLFEGHPHVHSFHVTDPLREALAERARSEAQRLISEEDTAEGNEGEP